MTGYSDIVNVQCRRFPFPLWSPWVRRSRRSARRAASPSWL